MVECGQVGQHESQNLGWKRNERLVTCQSREHFELTQVELVKLKTGSGWKSWRLQSNETKNVNTVNRKTSKLPELSKLGKNTALLIAQVNKVSPSKNKRRWTLTTKLIIQVGLNWGQSWCSVNCLLGAKTLDIIHVLSVISFQKSMFVNDQVFWLEINELCTTLGNCRQNENGN